MEKQVTSSVEELIMQKETIEVRLGMKLVYPLEEEITVTYGKLYDIIDNNDRKFSFNNGKLSFVYNKKLYVTRCNNNLIGLLEKNGYKLSNFFVYFSNGEELKRYF